MLSKNKFMEETKEKKNPPGKLWLFSVLIYIVANLIVETLFGVLAAFTNLSLESSRPFIILFSLIPAIYFYQRYKNNFNEKKDEVKKIALSALGLLIILFAILSIWLRSDRDSGLEKILGAMSVTAQQVRNDILENKTCFEDESLQNGKSDECITNIRKIQNTFRTTDKENLDKLESYYQTNQPDLNSDEKKMVEDSLRLYKSTAYSDLMNAYDQYFSAYIEWHKYFRDYVGIKGVDNLTSEETMMARDRAQVVVSTEENLQLKVNAFKDFTNENFDKEFIDALSAYSESLKK